MARTKRGLMNQIRARAGTPYVRNSAENSHRSSSQIRRADVLTEHLEGQAVSGNSRGEDDTEGAAEQSEDEGSGEVLEKDSEDVRDQGEVRDRENQKIIAFAKTTGRLPCLIWQPRNPVPTYCFKDLRTGRFVVSGGSEAMSASTLVRNFGPKGGEASRVDVAIHVVKTVDEEEAPSSFDRTRSQYVPLGEWNQLYQNEMAALMVFLKRSASRADDAAKEEPARPTRAAKIRRGKKSAKTAAEMPVVEGRIVVETGNRDVSTHHMPGLKMSSGDFMQLTPEVQLAIVEAERHTAVMRTMADAHYRR